MYHPPGGDYIHSFYCWNFAQLHLHPGYIELFFEFSFGDVISGLVGSDCLGVCSRKPAPYVIVVSAQSHLDPSCTVQCSQLNLGTSGSGGWVP